MGIWKILLSIVIGGILLSGCGNDEGTPEKKQTVYPNKFHNDDLLQVYKFKDRRLTHDLVRSLGSKDPVVRQEAALALGSVIDTASLTALTAALKDTVWQVRMNATFSIGQLRDSSATDALVAAYLKEPFSHVRLEMIHALGKFGSQRAITLIDGYAPTTKEDSLGMMWGYYRLALERPLTPVSVSRTIGVLNTPRTWMRAIACHVLARSRNVDMTPHKSELLGQIKADPEPVMRMSLCLALRDVDDEEVREVLQSLAMKDPDPRVRINAIRSLSSEVHLDHVLVSISEMVGDPHHLVRLQATKALQGKLTNDIADRMLEAAAEEPDAWVKAQLYRACLSSPIEPELKESVRIVVNETFVNSTDRYVKGCMIEALGGDVGSLDHIAELTFNASDPVVGTDGMGAMISIHRASGERIDPKMVEYYKQALGSKDVALIGMAAGAIREMDLKNAGIDSSYLANIQKTLELPREVEAWIELRSTMNYLAGIDEKVAAPSSASPVDWEYIKKIPRDQQVMIVTGKGEIVIDVFVEEAPASVGRFLQSIEEGFYDGKTFHRVVPNFVAQGGCPRGDGWGSPDWSLRSEFTTRHYITGAVGLASAGPDTESCQFFISHSPTPHLDGRYTLFGQVTDGLDVLQSLELGDVIIKAELIKGS